MLLAPAANLAPETLSVATDAVPEATSVAVPSAVLPTEKVTVPDGAAPPLGGVTVAVNCVVPSAAMLAGFAVTVILSATGAPVTVTVTEAVELAKFPVGA